MSIGLVSLKFGPIVISNPDLEYLREDMANIFLVNWKAKKLVNTFLCALLSIVSSLEVNANTDEKDLYK